MRAKRERTPCEYPPCDPAAFCFPSVDLPAVFVHPDKFTSCLLPHHLCGDCSRLPSFDVVIVVIVLIALLLPNDIRYAGLSLRPGSKGFATDVCVPISHLAELINYAQACIEESQLIGMGGGA